MQVIAWYHPNKTYRLPRLNRKKAGKLAQICVTVFIVSIGFSHIYNTIAPQIAYAGTRSEIAKATFMTGGIVALIPQLTFIAIVGYLFALVADAVGQSQISGMIKLVTVLSCIGAVVTAAGTVIGNIFKIFT